MSQYYGACHGTALVFSEQEMFDVFLPSYKKIALKTQEQKEDFERFLDIESFDEYVFSEENGITFQISPIRTDDCDGMLLIPLSSYTKSEDVAVELRFANVYVIWSEKPTSLKAWLSGESYKSKEELILEYKNMLSNYLPDDFDWESHIGEFSCSIYG